MVFIVHGGSHFHDLYLIAVMTDTFHEPLSKYLYVICHESCVFSLLVLDEGFRGQGDINYMHYFLPCSIQTHAFVSNEHDVYISIDASDRSIGSHPVLGYNHFYLWAGNEPKGSSEIYCETVSIVIKLF